MMPTIGQPLPPRPPEDQRRFEDGLRDVFEERIAFNRILGFTIESFDPVEPRVRFDMRPELVGHFLFGRLHGGVTSAVLDATAGFALMCAIADKHRDEPAEQVMHRFARMGTIDLRIDFLRQGIGEHFHAGARITRLGGRIGSTQMTLKNDAGLLIATGSASYVLS
ncbi:MAG: thioesterase family protein [Burkholderiaceae bacterium]|nr:thioesterase family protein [Burkholderiaceae bacterium]